MILKVTCPEYSDARELSLLEQKETFFGSMLPHIRRSSYLYIPHLVVSRADLPLLFFGVSYRFPDSQILSGFKATTRQLPSGLSTLVHISVCWARNPW